MRVFFGLLLAGLMILGGVVLLGMVRTMQPDGLGMSLGLLVGMMAGLPTALLVIAGGRRGRGCEPNPDRYQFTYPTETAQRQPGTALTYRQPSPVVYYRDEVGNDWRVEDWPQLTGGK